MHLYIHLALVVLFTAHHVHASLSKRRTKVLPRADIDLTTLPTCAQPYCNATAALSRSQLGCTEANLTKTCLCATAVAPLLCVPFGPSSGNNCWNDAEDWLAGQCDRNVLLVPRTSMPACLQKCTSEWLRTKGCRADTRNCFCKLDGKEVITAVDECKKAGCMSRVRPGFDVASWRDRVCTRKDVEVYQQAKYDARKRLVRDIRIGVGVTVGLLSLSLFVFLCKKGGIKGCMWGFCIVWALVLCMWFVLSSADGF